MSLPDGADFYMRPVVEKLITYDKLLDGSVGILHLAEMNDALDARAENSRRAQEKNK